MNDRTIYRLDDAVLGPLAVKELRYPRLLDRARATTVRRHRVLCEFHAAAAFARRGGRTPAMQAAMLEHERGLLTRVLIVMTWIESAVTLTDAFHAWPAADRDARVGALARHLADSAAAGLVHGRHSSENILVDDEGTFYTIDFSHAQLFPGYRERGFMQDVARIGARLVLERACSREAARALFAATIAAAPTATLTVSDIDAECERVLTESKRRQRLRRRWRTIWRGWPFRLGR